MISSSSCAGSWWPTSRNQTHHSLNWLCVNPAGGSTKHEFLSFFIPKSHRDPVFLARHPWPKPVLDSSCENYSSENCSNIPLTYYDFLDVFGTPAPMGQPRICSHEHHIHPRNGVAGDCSILRSTNNSLVLLILCQGAWCLAQKDTFEDGDENETFWVPYLEFRGHRVDDVAHCCHAG